MYSELDRQYIRKYLGFSAIFLQGDPRLESAITASQSLADLGSRPDSNAENDVKGLIYGTAVVAGPLVTPGGTAQNLTFAQPARQGLLAISDAINGLIPITFVLAADNKEAEIDPARGRATLRAMGRDLVIQMANILSTTPRPGNPFGAPATDEDDVYAHGLGAHNAGGDSTNYWP